MRALAVALAAIGMIAAAPAQQRLAPRRFDINAGVLVIESARVGTQADNPTPHVWYNLDRNTRIKPGGWNFANPRGGSRLTTAVQNRWTGIAAVVGGTVPGTTPDYQLTKADAPYWEVPLATATDDTLADFDVLLLSVRGFLSLQPLERAKLRAFVDQGGLLWIDVANSTVLDLANHISNAFAFSAGPPSNPRADLFHPLLYNPNQLSISQLGLAQTDSSPGIQAVDLAAAGLGSDYNAFAALPTEFNQYEIVASDDSGALVSLASLGNGHILVTARGVATAANRVRRPDGTYFANNQFKAAAPAFDSSSNAAASLIINALHLGASYNQAYFGSRKLNSTGVDLGAPLLRTFRAPISLDPGIRNFVPPATYKGRTYVVGNDGTGAVRMFAFDGLPNNDIDGDGDPDDGIADASTGDGLDLVWRSAPFVSAGSVDLSPVSGPTAVEVPAYTNPATRDQVLVVDKTGTVWSFDAFATGAPDLTNVAPKYQVEPPGAVPTNEASFDPSVDGRGPYAVTTFEGHAYVADVQSGVTGKSGRVWVVNLATGTRLRTKERDAGSGVVTTNEWSIGGATVLGLPDFSGSPTIGYIPVLDNSGALDLVMYVPSRPNSVNVSAQDATAGLTSLWMGAKDEKPIETSVVGSQLRITTRASLQALKIYVPLDPRDSGDPIEDPLSVQVSVVDTVTGNPLTTAELANLFDGVVEQKSGEDGILYLGLSGTWQPNYALRVSYRIDWGQTGASATSQIIRGQLFFPDASRTRRVLGSVALGPKGNMFVSVSNQNDGGSVYALREEGRGTFRLLYRYDVYERHVINLNMVSAVDYAETFQDEDGITALDPSMAGPLLNLTIQGAPAVRGDTVYVTATGIKGVNNPMTILMALDADPEPIKIPIGNVGTAFNILQPDFARSVNPNAPEIFSVLQPNQYSFERVGETGTVRITNMMSSTRGIIQQALSASQPLILRSSGQPDTLIEPNAVGGTWNPLLWYTIMHGASTQGPAMVTGDTVFVAGNSMQPDILSNISPAIDRGVLLALKAKISPVAPDAISITGRPWLKQVPLLTIDGSNVKPNDAVLWPRPGPSMSYEQWKTRYLQTALRRGDTVYGIAGGDGALYAFGPTKLYGFTRGELLVADEGRLLRLDASGTVLWSSDTTRNSGSTSSATASSTITPLTRPTRAYRIGQEIVAVDPGSNKIVRMDQGGRAIRSFTGYQLDPNYRPEGFQAGSSANFNNPSDVAVFSTYVGAADNQMTGAQAQEYWIHYLVADAGNRRILELVDRYAVDPTNGQILGPVAISGESQIGILVWQNSSSVGNKNFAYNSVDKAFNKLTGSLVYAAGIGGTQPTAADLGQETPGSTSTRESSTGSGGIVLFDGSRTEVISEITLPPQPAGVYYGGTNFDAPALLGRKRPLLGVNSVTMRYISLDDPGTITRLAIMFTDSTGVYEIYQPTVGPTQPWVVRWMLPNKVYTVMRRDDVPPIPAISPSNPRDLRAMFARRLDSGEVLVVNGYLGRTRGNTPFSGEVLILNGDFDGDAAVPGFDFSKRNLGFSQASIRLQLDQLENVRGLEVPVFADLR